MQGVATFHDSLNPEREALGMVHISEHWTHSFIGSMLRLAGDSTEFFFHARISRPLSSYYEYHGSLFSGERIRAVGGDPRLIGGGRSGSLRFHPRLCSDNEAALVTMYDALGVFRTEDEGFLASEEPDAINLLAQILWLCGGDLSRLRGFATELARQRINELEGS